jgi:hypothetical protein
MGKSVMSGCPRATGLDAARRTTVAAKLASLFSVGLLLGVSPDYTARL